MNFFNAWGNRLMFYFLCAGLAVLVCGVLLYRRAKVIKVMNAVNDLFMDDAKDDYADNFICIHCGDKGTVSGLIDGGVTIQARRIKK